MKLSTRLLLPFIATVVFVMTMFAVWAIRQRERTLTEESRRETHAHAVALGLAIDAAFRSGAPDDVQDIIDRLSQERTVYGVLVYGGNGRMLYVSNPLTAEAAAPPDVVQRVLRTGQVSSVDRVIDGQGVFAVVRPIVDAAGVVVGAFEVAQPLSFLEQEIARTRQRFVLNTLTLLAAVAFLIYWVVRRTITTPLERVVAGAQALGRGELAHRLEDDAGGAELIELAREFNRMAEHLESARLDLVREGDERVALERRLHETEKLAAVGNLAAGLAHEIAAPLHV
ncbi:MAG: HAMP domain-containing protein, partial [Gemmatimonadetes bacterium]|nr:HAMP domain-containing protein [Gemmatimonadota bacterium]